MIGAKSHKEIYSKSLMIGTKSLKEIYSNSYENMKISKDLFMYFIKIKRCIIKKRIYFLENENAS